MVRGVVWVVVRLFQKGGLDESGGGVVCLVERTDRPPFFNSRDSMSYPEELFGDMEVTDGAGISYRLPPRLRVADCSICKKLVVRDREKVPVEKRKFLNYIGGWKRQYENHIRPVCLRCWDAEMRGEKHV